MHFLFISISIFFLQTGQSKKVCYGKYGCFSNDAPFNTNVLSWFSRPLPSPPEEMETKYHLFTRQDPAGTKTIDDSDVNKLKDSTYDGSKRTIFIIHGWRGRPVGIQWVNEMKDALLEKEDVNVIVTGWKKGAQSLFYPKAVGNTRLVGAMVAELIRFLNIQTNNGPESFHIIGFSLGAQIAGYAGKRLYDITNSKIARITGLDPASPGYMSEHIDVRLDASDGNFVDVIHSDVPEIGTPSKSGKFDFWPNGGSSQPGCLISRKRGVISEVFSLFSCDHRRAHQYFIESIKSVKCLLRAYRCSSWKAFTRGACMQCDALNCPEMGYNAIKYRHFQKGNFYLNTNKDRPYCVPRYMYLTFETGSISHRFFGKIGAGYNPRVRIYGTKNETGEIRLQGKLDVNSRERFVIPIKNDLGELKSVAVQNHRNLNVLDPWKVDKVTLQYVDSKQSFYACFNVKVFRFFKERNLRRGNAPCSRN